MNSTEIEELDLAILRYLRDNQPHQLVNFTHKHQVIKEFGNEANIAISDLISRKYVTVVDGLGGLRISARGKSFLESQKNIEISWFSNNVNSNLADGSQGIKQSAKISKHTGDVHSNIENNNQWIWWVLGIIGTIIAGLVLAFVFGVGK